MNKKTTQFSLYSGIFIKYYKIIKYDYIINIMNNL